MDLEAMRQLRESWIIDMQASKTPANTVTAYAGSLRLYLDWHEGRGVTKDLDQPAQVRAFLAHLAAAGRSAKTMNVRLSALRVFAQWAVKEQELAAHDLDRVDWAKADRQIPAQITDEQRDALIATCGSRSFKDTRDAALIWLMRDSLLRADEVLSIRARGDLDLRKRSVRVRRGKGGKERMTGFSPRAALLLDRYQRARGRHKHAASDAYWVGKYGPLRYPGLWQVFKDRGAQAGIADIHPHMTRNGGAIAWKRAGGSTEGLMAIGGWESLEMVQHYVRAAEIELALEEQQRLYSRD
jgi:integrase/recombinase XerD